MPNVSICIPTYCQIEFLRLTLESVQHQNYKDYELIISDDSPDESVINLVNSFCFEQPLRIYKNPIPLGSPHNWNSAISKATGTFIKILHHDDRFSDPTALAKLVKLMESTQADFGFCNSLVIDGVNGKSRIHKPTSEQLQMLKEIPEMLFSGNVIGAPSSTIYRNKNNQLLYDSQLKWLVDVDFYIRALKSGKFAYLDETLIVTPTNVGHQVTEVCKNNLFLELNEYSILYLKHETSLQTHKAAITQWNSLFGRYNISSTKEIFDMHIFNDAQKRVIQKMLDNFNKQPILKLVYFIYWRLFTNPKIAYWIQEIIKLAYYTFDSFRSKFKT